MDVEALASVHQLWHSSIPTLYSSITTWVLDTCSSTLQVLKGPDPTDKSSSNTSTIRLVYTIPRGVGIVEHGIPPDGAAAPKVKRRCSISGPIRTALFYQPETGPGMLAVRGNNRVISLIDEKDNVEKLWTEGDGWSLGLKDDKLYAGDRAGHIYIWDAGKRMKISDIALVDAPIEDLVASSLVDGMMVASCHGRSVKIIDVRADASIAMSLSTRGQVFKVVTSPFEPYWVAMGDEDGRFSIRDLRNPTKHFVSHKAHLSPCLHVAFAPSHRDVLVTGGDDTQLAVWKVLENEAKCQFIHAGHTAPITGLDFVPNRPLTVVSSAEDNSLMIWTPNITLD